MKARERIEIWLARMLAKEPAPPRLPQAEPISSATGGGGFRADLKVLDDVGAVSFPIDVVYTWVDLSGRLRSDLECEDPANASPKVVDDSLFQAHDELRYSLRSVEAYLPWVNRIYLVTNGERPSWLHENPRLRLVSHEDILERECLPTFNSHVIGSALHRIPGLSEHYIYLNDDVMFMRPCQPNDFFTASGLSYALLGSVVLPDEPPRPEETATNWAAKNARRLVRERFGVSFDRRFAHVFHCQRKSTGEECEELFAAEFAAFRRNKLRNMNDVLVAGFLQHVVSYLRARSIFVRMEHWYVQTRRYEALKLYRRILSERDTADARIAACFNDQPLSEGLMADSDRALQRFLESYFPTPSSFEKPESP